VIELASSKALALMFAMSSNDPKARALISDLHGATTKNQVLSVVNRYTDVITPDQISQITNGTTIDPTELTAELNAHGGDSATLKRILLEVVGYISEHDTSLSTNATDLASCKQRLDKIESVKL
jgi:hypothetical protein